MKFRVSTAAVSAFYSHIDPQLRDPDAPGGPFDLGVHELQSLELEIFADRFEEG